jgi:nucleotide-binding universal stress UspA family protein
MRILVALDGSPECEWALPVAAKMVEVFNADVYLLQVLTGFATTKGHVHHEPEWEGGIEGEILALMKKARNYLDELVSRYELPTDRTRCLVGRNEAPPNEIIDVARNNGIDLIVMTSHCRNWLGQLTQGSCCSEVVQAKVCPVLSVPVHRAGGARKHRGLMGARR